LGFEITDRFFEVILCLFTNDRDIDVSYCFALYSGHNLSIDGRDNKFISSNLFFEDFFGSVFIDPFYGEFDFGSFWTSDLAYCLIDIKIFGRSGVDDNDPIEDF